MKNTKHGVIGQMRRWHTRKPQWGENAPYPPQGIPVPPIKTGDVEYDPYCMEGKHAKAKAVKRN